MKVRQNQNGRVSASINSMLKLHRKGIFCELNVCKNPHIVVETMSFTDSKIVFGIG